MEIDKIIDTLPLPERLMSQLFTVNVYIRRIDGITKDYSSISGGHDPFINIKRGMESATSLYLLILDRQMMGKDKDVDSISVDYCGQIIMFLKFREVTNEVEM